MDRFPVAPLARMSPLLRIWAMLAGAIALLLVLRGALLPAIAVFVLSPAPALLFARGYGDPRRLSITWIGAVALVLLAFAALIAIIVALGGIPQVHEWGTHVRG